MGSDAIALPALNGLARSTDSTSSPQAGSGQAGSELAQVVAVFTQPDRAAGRGQQVQANAIKRWALERGLPVLQPEKVGEAERRQLADFQPDLLLVMAYGHMLKQEVDRKSTRLNSSHQ